jgi:hypothetical protein
VYALFIVKYILCENINTNIVSGIVTKFSTIKFIQ